MIPMSPLHALPKSKNGPETETGLDPSTRFHRPKQSDALKFNFSKIYAHSKKNLRL